MIGDLSGAHAVWQPCAAGLLSVRTLLDDWFFDKPKTGICRWSLLKLIDEAVGYMLEVHSQPLAAKSTLGAEVSPAVTDVSKIALGELRLALGHQSTLRIGPDGEGGFYTANSPASGLPRLDLAYALLTAGFSDKPAMIEALSRGASALTDCVSLPERAAKLLLTAREKLEPEQVALAGFPLNPLEQAKLAALKKKISGLAGGSEEDRAEQKRLELEIAGLMMEHESYLPVL